MTKFYLILIASFCFDQVSKWFVVLVEFDFFKLNRCTSAIFKFSMGWNYGVNFGLFGQQSELKSYFLIVL